MVGYFFITCLMALALAMDAFTVAFTFGMDGSVKTWPQRVRASLVFGFFQGLLFAVGLFLYQILSGEIARYNSIIAGIILLALGGHSLIGAFDPQITVEKRQFSLLLLCVLGIATSIDALVAGISFNLIYDHLSEAVTIVATIGVCLTYAGMFFGQRLGNRLGNKANIIGGIVIIILGLKSIFY